MFKPAVFLPLLVIISLASGCAFSRPAEMPIASEYYHYQPSNSTLIVLLHGRGGAASNFIKYGAVEQIVSCQPKANILGVDSHFGYYRERIIEERLHEDIIKPALDNGTRQVWLLGISMGGLGSLVYRQRYPEDVEAVILMAPYLGKWNELYNYVNDPELARESGDQGFVGIWDALTTIPVDDPAITLAYGESDGNNNQHRWMASLLDDSRVISGPGGHNWNIWKKLWPEALERSGLCDIT